MPRGASAHCSPVQPAVGLLEPPASTLSCPHREHAELPAGEYVPAGHLSHSSVFVSGVKVPAAHRRHPGNLASSSSREYVPGAQSSQRSCPRRGLFCPGGHGSHGPVSYTHLRAHETLMNL
eukprot:1656928-Prymnesium_polylepis.1